MHTAFEHERRDVYQLDLEFLASAPDLMAAVCDAAEARKR